MPVDTEWLNKVIITGHKKALKTLMFSMLFYLNEKIAKVIAEKKCIVPKS